MNILFVLEVSPYISLRHNHTVMLVHHWGPHYEAVSLLKTKQGKENKNTQNSSGWSRSEGYFIKISFLLDSYFCVFLWMGAQPFLVDWQPLWIHGACLSGPPGAVWNPHSYIQGQARCPNTTQTTMWQPLKPNCSVDLFAKDYPVLQMPNSLAPWSGVNHLWTRWKAPPSSVDSEHVALIIW